MIKFCSQHKNLTAINFLLSAPEDENFRYQIRSRWGNEYWLQWTGIKVVHILGYSQDPQINQAILQENKMFRDIIQVNFMDSYENLTLKTLSILHWTKHYCKNVQWVIKSDTDVLVNIFQMPKQGNQRIMA